MSVPEGNSRRPLTPGKPYASSNSMDIPESEAYDISAPDYEAECNLTMSRFADSSAAATVQCMICRSMPSNGVRSPCCSRVFCTKCICQTLTNGAQCPACQHTLRASELAKPSDLFCQLLANWSVHCGSNSVVITAEDLLSLSCRS